MTTIIAGFKALSIMSSIFWIGMYSVFGGALLVQGIDNLVLSSILFVDGLAWIIAWSHFLVLLCGRLERYV
jgi:hypothetical protein